MKPVHILGLAVFLAACAMAVIEYTVRATFTDMEVAHAFDW